MRAAFGSAVAFNQEVTAETATEIMSSFVECVVAPSYEPKALEIFNDQESFKLNKHIRIIECRNVDSLPKYTGDGGAIHNSIKVLADGSLVIAAPLTTSLKSVDDLQPAKAENKRCGEQKSEKEEIKEEQEHFSNYGEIKSNYIGDEVEDDGLSSYSRKKKYR